jgi:hypothetical protein
LRNVLHVHMWIQKACLRLDIWTPAVTCGSCKCVTTCACTVLTVITDGQIDVDRCDIKSAGPGGDPLALASLDPDAVSGAAIISAHIRVPSACLPAHSVSGGVIILLRGQRLSCVA